MNEEQFKKYKEYEKKVVELTKRIEFLEKLDTKIEQETEEKVPSYIKETIKEIQKRKV